MGSHLKAGGFGRLMQWTGEASREAEALFAAIESLGFTQAIKHIQEHPPSARCIAMLAYVAQEASIKEQTRRAARVANAPKAAAREWAVTEWQAYRTRHGGNKSAFAREYVPKLYERFRVRVTHKTITDTWLKG